MMRKNNVNAEVATKLEAIMGMLEKMDARIDALENASTPAPKKKTTTKSAKTTTTKKSTPKSTTKTTTKTSAKKTAPKSEPKTKATMSIADFEPCKYKDSGNYVWNGVRGYKAMRSAYCYAKQTNGKAKNLAEARVLGITVDFDKKWAKDKAEFEKKYKYVKAEDRQ